MNMKTWQVRPIDDAMVAALQAQLPGTSERLCALLVARGLHTHDLAKEFFVPALDTLHCPWKLQDMDKAVHRILTALKEGENILLFGDYDVDGTASVAMMYRFLAKHTLADRLSYYIPDRYTEGYGLSRAGIEYAIEKEVTLIITLDCGITGNELINHSSTADGIDYIVCDHHLPGTELPRAVAILNPHRHDCSYPFKDLCGAGVAFKLLMALCERLGEPSSSYLCYLDLVALATGADVVPILGENRVLVHFGLERLNNNPCSGIAALKELNEKPGDYNLNRVVFNLAPKINAAGRMEHGRQAVRLLMEDDPEVVGEIARKLHDHNEVRRQHDLQVTKEAIELLRTYDPEGNSRSTVVYKEGWHKGVLGIVASRLIESYHRPTIVLTSGDHFISGSARSIAGFNIYEAICGCAEYLVHFGGHTAAAGLTIRPEQVEHFKKKFEAVVSDTLLPEHATPKLTIDLEIELHDINFLFYNSIRRMEPFGAGNPEPVFFTKSLLPRESRIVGSDHVRFVFLTTTGRYLTGISFNAKDKLNNITPGKRIDIAYTIDENIWNDKKSLQLKVIDFKLSAGN